MQLDKDEPLKGVEAQSTIQSTGAFIVLCVCQKTLFTMIPGYKKPKQKRIDLVTRPAFNHTTFYKIQCVTLDLDKGYRLISLT